MGVTKQQTTPGNGTDKPKAGDTITMEYTGFLYDEKAENKKGNKSVSRCPSPLRSLIVVTGLTLQLAAETSRPRLE